jgi:lysophospholipid acyltransferase (LPLAT)-like uncharacterized protein
MRVDDVPWWLKPAFHTFGYGMGLLVEGSLRSIRHTCRFEGLPAGPQEPRIECIWHEHLPAYMASYLPPRLGAPVMWMNHPAWYMRPIHVSLGLRGVPELALGSTGHGGQAALAQVVARLRQGYSTGLAVDGPAGPAHVLKRGAIDMARLSGRKLVAIRFEYERAVRLPGWDRKFWPLPGSTVRVFESNPLTVATDSVEAHEQLARELGE